MEPLLQMAGLSKRFVQGRWRQKQFGVKAAKELVPPHPTLGDVDSAQALVDYQAAKRARKAERSKANAQT